jgi:23S rRNA (cytidine1920-2'-O)/16S rRNA (cytidine1409-2'-O)-methyltransferase
MAHAQRLDEAVAERAGVTRARARSLIIAGRVRVDGRPMTKPGASVSRDAGLDVERPRPYVSRGGEKLEGALDAFALNVTGVRALDVGASTGGFTDCLLARGAAHVTAVDVGYGQLALQLRDDPRVAVLERTNFRLLPDGALAPPFDFVTIDASFISVVTMIARAQAFLAPGGAIVALVKPQFEAGPSRLGGGGVVRDPAVRATIVREVRDAIAKLDLVVVGAMRSPLRGPAGNVEFFFELRRTGDDVDDARLDAVVAEAHGEPPAQGEPV